MNIYIYIFNNKNFGVVSNLLLKYFLVKGISGNLVGVLFTRPYGIHLKYVHLDSECDWKKRQKEEK